MRPKIDPCKRVRISLCYNEQKVEEGKATFLLAANFIKDGSRLSFEDKLSRFTRLMQLNSRIRTSNLHISLNFHPSDIISDEQMKQIARLYMKEIGFGQQPYLVYRHHDAGHPHIHVVSTHIRPDGSPIPLYNIGRNQSKQARQKIEAQFGLISSDKKEKPQRQKITSGVQRVLYGQSPIAPSISAVLEYVTEQFKFTSLEEFNAILRLYNVEACPGKKQSDIQKPRGLLYRALDQDGNRVGVPLKASFFDCRPTLANLEKKFILHQSERQQHQEQQKRTTTNILWPMTQQSIGLTAFIRKLQQEKISLVMQKDKEGQIKSIVYVDFSNKCAFGSAALDKRCSLTEIQKLADRELLIRLQESQAQSQDRRQRNSPRHSL